MPEPKSYTLAELRHLHGFTVSDMRSWDEQGLLPVLWKTKRTGRVLAEDLDRFLAERWDRGKRDAQQRDLRQGYLEGQPDRAFDFLTPTGTTKWCRAASGRC